MNFKDIIEELEKISDNLIRKGKEIWDLHEKDMTKENGLVELVNRNAGTMQKMERGRRIKTEGKYLKKYILPVFKTLEEHKSLIWEAIDYYIHKYKKDIKQIEGNMAQKKDILKKHQSSFDKIYRGSSRERFFGDIGALESQIKVINNKITKLKELKEFFGE